MYFLLLLHCVLCPYRRHYHSFVRSEPIDGFICNFQVTNCLLTFYFDSTQHMVLTVERPSTITVIGRNEFTVFEQFFVLTSPICPAQCNDIWSVNRVVAEFHFWALEEIISVWLVSVDFLSVLKLVTVRSFRLPYLHIFTFNFRVNLITLSFCDRYLGLFPAADLNFTLNHGLALCNHIEFQVACSTDDFQFTSRIEHLIF